MRIYLSCFLITLSVTCFAQKQVTSFSVVPLGVLGGSDESNLSCYALAAAGTDDYVCLDAGTLYSGLRKSIQHGVWKGTEAEILKAKVKGYLISHPHLDHVAGLIINAPDDSSKPIYGLPFTLEVLTEKYFSWKSWANFTDKGEPPALSKFHMTSLTAGTELSLEHTTMSVTAFPLSHTNTSQSTAFLVRQNDSFVLYLGDTGADETEKSTYLNTLWEAVAPFIKDKKLKGIFIETSYPSAKPDNLLFGHFTPKWLMKELRLLESKSGPGSLKGFPIIITHIKPSGENEEIIKKELTASNTLAVKLIFPTQGVKFGL